MKTYLGAVLCLLLLLNAHASCAEGNIPAKQAKEQGISGGLLERIESISSFLIKDRPHGAHSYWITENPSERTFSSAMEISFSDGPEFAYMFATKDRFKDEDWISSGYVRIWYSPKNFVQTMGDFTEFKYMGTLSKDIVMMKKEDASLIFYLMPAGDGTIVIKRE
ncbi:hypothetical protein [Desulfocurvibacter africanus]|uniref:Lipoprotein n=1 Tax=Desulfocurvibacter africanus subsp. africanus str. Walvis Bay TaxID=690850 RepID=F3YVQ0_DESAF|nr:hypothetical protein [Desulfocurvibacter africanus]EGJ48786.1 hypothetical protein Desaf_0431 [Desulfocurvibacter africanus subsp. africanus str. Walvis Bay]